MTTATRVIGAAWAVIQSEAGWVSRLHATPYRVFLAAHGVTNAKESNCIRNVFHRQQRASAANLAEELLLLLQLDNSGG